MMNVSLVFSHFPHEYQSDRKDCGPTAVKIIAQYFGRNYSLSYLRELCGVTRKGVSFLGLTRAFETIGFLTHASEAGMQEMKDMITLPCIVHWNGRHFAVVYRVSKKHVFVSDPAKGFIKYDFDSFKKGWCTRPNEKGAFLAVELLNKNEIQ